MKKKDAIELLTKANNWRRERGENMPNTTELGEAIDFAINFMDGVQLDMEVNKVQIECPVCKETCYAQVISMDYAPFSDYFHECEHCGHMITESEWEEVK